MTKRIRVTCGKEEYKFKLGSTAVSVLDTLGRMHPPRGCLKYVDDAGLVALSQEQLSQLNYTYHPGQPACDVVDDTLIGAVMRLQVRKGKKVEMCGTAVLCTSTGICLTADHCLSDLPRRPNLLIGGHAATICARDPKKDIAALKIRSDIGLPFLKLAACLIERMMKVQLVSYPVMADSDYAPIDPTITHGQVVNFWTPNVVAADYASFSNSSGGAVIYKNHLIGIHVESLWQEDSQLKEEVGLEGKVAYLERNMGNKSSLASFVNAAAICNFLNDHGLLAMPTSGASSSASGPKRRPRMVTTPQ